MWVRYHIAVVITAIHRSEPLRFGTSLDWAYQVMSIASSSEPGGQVLLPGQTSAPNLGIVPVEAWIMAGVLYTAFAAPAARSRNAQTILGFAQHLRRGSAEVSVPAPGATP